MTSTDIIPERNRRLVQAENGENVKIPSEYLRNDPAAGLKKIDIRQVLAAAYRSRLLLSGAIAVTLAGGAIVTLLTPPEYESASSIQIEQQSQRILDTDSGDLQPTVPANESDRFLQTQAEILRSRALAQRVVNALGLARNDDFIVSMGGEPVEPSKFANATRQRIATSYLMHGLEVVVLPVSRIATITFTSPVPELSARISNQFADEYIQWNLTRRLDSSTYAREFLQGQIYSTKRRLESSEQGLLGYARAANLVDITDGAAAQNGGSLPVSNLRSLNDSYAQARTQRIEAEERWRAAQKMPLLAIPEVVASPTVQQLIQQRSAKQLELKQLHSQYLDNHVTVRQAEMQMQGINQEINSQAQNVLATLKGRYQAALQAEDALQANVNSLRQISLDEQGRRVQYNILKREVDTNRVLYDALLQRLKELTATSGALINNVSIVDRAEVPLIPVRPNAIVNMILALLAGLSIGALIVLFRELLDDVVRKPNDVEAKLGLPLLGIIPLAPRGSSVDDELADARSAISEAYYSLRTSIELSCPNGEAKTLLLTSSSPAEGKSTSSIALANGFGRLGKRVLLLDGDLRKPTLHRRLNLSTAAGLSNLLARQCELSDVVQKTPTQGVDFVACGPLPPNPAELLASSALSRVFADMIAAYDLVVIDGPPVIGLADVQLLSSHADAVVFVVETNKAHGGQAKNAIKRLNAADANLIGVALTKFDTQSPGFGYADDYGYTYNYNYGQSSAKAESKNQA